MNQISKKFSKAEAREITYDYFLYLPKGYSSESEKKWPLILFLHGAGERGDELERVKCNGLPNIVDSMEEFPFIVISPHCPANTWWIREVDNLNIFLDEILDSYNIDKKSVFLTGISMGGYGTWHFGMAYPEKFAAIAPICGGGMAWNAETLKNVPVWAFHGAKDNVVSITETESMVNALKSCGCDVTYTIYPEADHDSWTETYKNPELYKWLLDKASI